MLAVVLALPLAGPKRTAGQEVGHDQYKICQEAGFLLSHDSPALAKNFALQGPGTEDLDPPPWYDIQGNEISYIGACPEIRNEQVPISPPNSPGSIKVTSGST